MKYLVLALTFLFLSCNNQSKSVEDELYDCMLNALSDLEEEKFEQIVVKFEQYLIEKGALNSVSAEGYWNLYKKIAETGSYKYPNDFNLSEKISFLDRENIEDNFELIECQDAIMQSEKYLNSKQYKLKQELIALRKHQVTQMMIAQTIIENLSIEDFESEYNRLWTLMYIEETYSKSK